MKMKRTTFLEFSAIFVLIMIHLVISEVNHEVHDLSSDNICSLTKGKSLFVLAFTPNCIKYKILTESWSKLSNEFKNQELIQFAKINCENYEKLCRKLNVTIQPTVLWVLNGESSIVNGGRSAKINQLTVMVDDKIKFFQNQPPEYSGKENILCQIHDVMQNDGASVYDEYDEYDYEANGYEDEESTIRTTTEQLEVDYDSTEDQIIPRKIFGLHIRKYDIEVSTTSENPYADYEIEDNQLFSEKREKSSEESKESDETKNSKESDENSKESEEKSDAGNPFNALFSLFPFGLPYAEPDSNEIDVSEENKNVSEKNEDEIDLEKVTESPEKGYENLLNDEDLDLEKETEEPEDSEVLFSSGHISANIYSTTFVFSFVICLISRFVIAN